MCHAHISLADLGFGLSQQKHVCQEEHKQVSVGPSPSIQQVQGTTAQNLPLWSGEMVQAQLVLQREALRE